MPFANGCSHEFGYRVRERGEEYFHEGRVSRLSRGKDRVTASVLGSSTVYQVVLDWGDARRSVVAATCTCPYFDDRGPCKHIWATMLTADARGVGPQKGTHKLSVLEADSDDEPANEGFPAENRTAVAIVRARATSRITCARGGNAETKRIWLLTPEIGSRRQQLTPVNSGTIIIWPAKR